MDQFMFTQSFLAMLKDMIDMDAQATVRNLCVAHIGRKTQSRLVKRCNFPLAGLHRSTLLPEKAKVTGLS